MSATTTTVEVRRMTVDLSIENAEDRVHRGRAYAPSRATVNYSAYSPEPTCTVSWPSSPTTYAAPSPSVPTPAYACPKSPPSTGTTST